MGHLRIQWGYPQMMMMLVLCVCGWAPWALAADPTLPFKRSH